MRKANLKFEEAEAMNYHPGIEPGVDFVYGGNQDQYLEPIEDEQHAVDANAAMPEQSLDAPERR